MAGSTTDWVLEGDRILTSGAAAVAVRSLVPVNAEDLPEYMAQALAARIASALAIPLTENRALQADYWGLYQQLLREAAALDGLQGRTRPLNSTAFGYVAAAGRGRR